MKKNTRITLLISGSIAAYKTPELARELIKRGALVRVALSTAAQAFVTPLTLQTLTGNSVFTNMFDASQEAQIGHIALADEAELVLVAPATANIIAKAAAGIADSVLTSVLLATRAPIIFAPAMNVNMWEHPLTKKNVQTLEALGVYFIDPAVGELACGWEGAGRLPEIEVIADCVESRLSTHVAVGNVRTLKP